MLVCVLQVHDVRICRLIISQCAVVTCAMMKTASTRYCHFQLALLVYMYVAAVL